MPLGGLAPEPPFTQSTELEALVLAADPQILWKIKVARGKFRGKSQKFASVGGLRLWTARSDRIFI